MLVSTKSRTPRLPKERALRPKLAETTLYVGDNGRIFCGALRCAGTSAHFTGRTIAGQRVRKVDAKDQREFKKYDLKLACASCGREMAS